MIVRKKNKYEHGGYHEPPDGFTLEDYIRQMYAESRFDPKAGSPVGAAGLAQIMPSTRQYMIGRYNLPETVDVYNPQDARTMQRKYMEDLYGRDWNTGSDENKKLKALAAYNYGPTNVIRALEKAKKQGYDIYEDTSWTKDPKVLPKETRDYLDRTYFATDEAFEKEYSSARPKYFELFPEDADQKRPTVEAPEPIQKVDPKLQNALEMIPQRPALDPQLKEAFKIMGFKGYKNGGVTVKKYEHGGGHPTKEEKRQQMLQTGRFTEGPNGELIRVSQKDQYGFPTTDRVRDLAQSTSPLNEEQLREYISYSSNPTNPVNTAFSMIAAGHPAAEAVDVIGNVIGKGLGYAGRKGSQVMNFLRPKADEAVEAVDAALMGMRQSEMPNYMSLSKEDRKKHLSELIAKPKSEFQEGLDEIADFLRRRKKEVMSPEGQRRLEAQIKADLDYMRGLSGQSDEALERMGFDSQGISRMRGIVSASDPDSYVKTQLAAANKKIAGITDITSRESFDWIDDFHDEVRRLVKEKDAAYYASDYERVSDIQDDLAILNEQVAEKYDEMAGSSMNAFFSPDTDEIIVGRGYLGDPQVARVSAAHEFQHGLLTDTPFSESFYNRVSGNQVGIPRTTEADRILHDELKLLNSTQINDIGPMSDDMKDALFNEIEYMKTHAFMDTPFGKFPTGRGGTGSEMTPHLAEMREDMLEEGFIPNRYAEVSEHDIEDYLEQYRQRDPSYSSGYAYLPDLNDESVRILEMLDPQMDSKNTEVLARAMNKMLVAVPAVGAGVGALSSGQNEYRKGGKFKVRKAKQYGYSVRKK